ncbi:hypothetical protein BU23DRAFT_559631 [Bimuria novae-zelandiae CBS 107.79]|uniref:AGC-kinase C-terminal domain-containing protein n=1 Tax=Bimuria novae-zelandiae CBS 107.79 TaxID=1447943 RepID=A0A6A5V188_9PLEO|nr:hypothetical protein BU23DRAFT_559631 [Bimuria novae-zelandiae CBS 107.79]
MAPFFSTKRNAARRNASSLASPEPVSSPHGYLLSSPQDAGNEYFTSPRLADNASYTSSSPVSPFPPQLPPIPRVASKLDKGGKSSLLSPQHHAPRRQGPAAGDAHDHASRSPSQVMQHQQPPGHDARPPSSPLPAAAGGQPSRMQSLGQSIAQVVDKTMHLERPLTQPSTQHLAPSTLSSNYSNYSKSQTSLMSGLSEKLSHTPKPPTPTAQPPKSGKSRLRNPMSLLLRRRSGQPLEALHDESLVTQRSPSIVPPIPDNYDPSIRGRIVHDFSAPRPNRNFSYSNAYGDEPQRAEPSPAKIEREHTPVFTEHFDDDTSYEQSQAAIRAEQLANKDFLKRNSYIPEPPARSPPPPPPQEMARPKVQSPPVSSQEEQLTGQKHAQSRSSYVAEPPARSPPPPPTPPPPVAEGSSILPPLQTAPPLAETNQDYTSFVLSPVQEAPSPTDVSAEVTPRKRKSTKTPPSSRSRATSVTDLSFVPAGLPKHLTSRASRFSFQIGGGESAAQEKMMEDRHIQKAAEKASKSEARMSANSMGDDYDEYGMDDDFDMDAGYEEEIPMLGEDDDFGGGLGDQMLSPGMGAFDFSALSIQPNMNPLSPLGMTGGTHTPVDANGHRIGFAMSLDTFQSKEPSAGAPYLENNAKGVSLSQDPQDNARNMDDPSLAGVPTGGFLGLGLTNLPQSVTDDFTPDDPQQHATVEPTKSVSFAQAGLDDDMYFDDGMIEEQGDVDAGEFDEGVFDDPEGPLFDRKVRPAPTDELRTALSLHPLDGLSSETGYEADEDTLTKSLEASEPSLAHKTSRAQSNPDRNLNAYHSALAEAANRAEAEGRFARKPSVDTTGLGRSNSDADNSSSISNLRPSLVPDDDRFSQETTGFPPADDNYGMSSSFDDCDYSEYDSVMDDDMMIAEANSEALANDDDGFYGQEFGFYAGPQGEAVNSYGGYFGSSGLGRTTSGRNAMREPNLTPITERSEYSTRNSFISVRHLGDANSLTSPGFTGQSLTSPALAQLARISPYGWRDEEDMSMDALMRLRKGAFGSTASLPAGSPGASPRNSSPMGMQFAPRTASPAGNRMREQNEDSFESDGSAAILDSLEESEEDDQALMDAVNEDFGDDVLDQDDEYEERPDSPTLTTSDYNSLSSPTNQLANQSYAPPVPLMPLHSPPAIPPAGIPLPMSPNYALSSPSTIPLSSPNALPLPSPFTMPPSTSPAPHYFQHPPPLTLHTSFQPPSITSPTLSSATATNSSAPRRQSLGLISPVSTTSPVTPSGTAWRAGHSRKGSAADSVAYVREHDEAGEGRWVLERRRTAESGELELIGREIVEGGRI